MNNQIDVLIHIPSLRGGGAERVALELARYSADRSLRVAFFVHQSESDYALPTGVTLICASRTSHIGRLFELRRILVRRKVRSLISLLPYANLLSILARIGNRARTNVVVSEHLSLLCRPDRHYRLNSVKERIKLFTSLMLYPFADAIVAVSSGIAAELDERMPRIGKRNLVVIHNPCYVQVVCSGQTRAISTCPKVLAVGRLAPQKGFDTLIRAFALVRREISTASLTILGEGPERPQLEALVASEGLLDCVSLPGFTGDVFHAYRKADLFVCSSRAEGFGNVLVEALSFGLPIVSTECPHGPAEILQDGRFGMLVPVDDVPSMATAIVRSLNTPSDPSRQISRARDFSLDEIGARYLGLAGWPE